MESSLEQQVSQINGQLIALFFILGSVIATIYLTFGYKDLLINEKNSSFNKEELGKIAEYSSLVFFIVAIYYLILAFDNYENEKNEANLNYLIAANLALGASGIRYYQISKQPSSVEGAEDVVG